MGDMNVSSSQFLVFHPHFLILIASVIQLMLGFNQIRDARLG